MHHYIFPRNNGITLIKTEEFIPQGSIKDGTYGYLLPVGTAYNHQWVIGQINAVRPNPLAFDIN